jgi:hypothetical protein
MWMLNTDSTRDGMNSHKNFLMGKGKKVKVFSYKPEVALGVPGG